LINRRTEFKPWGWGKTLVNVKKSDISSFDGVPDFLVTSLPFTTDGCFPRARARMLSLFEKLV